MTLDKLFNVLYQYKKQLNFTADIDMLSIDIAIEDALSFFTPYLSLKLFSLYIALFLLP